MAQRFYNLVLLPRIRDDIAEYKKLNFHLYSALKKALFKPGAWFKGQYDLVSTGVLVPVENVLTPVFNHVFIFFHIVCHCVRALGGSVVFHLHSVLSAHTQALCLSQGRCFKSRNKMTIRVRSLIHKSSVSLAEERGVQRSLVLIPVKPDDKLLS